MTANDFMLPKFLELPWPVLRNICLHLNWDQLHELISIPQLRNFILDLVCHEKVKIYPALDKVKVQWNQEEVTVSQYLSRSTIFDFFKEYPEIKPRVYSVCAHGAFVNDVTPFLHDLLKRAENVEIWSLELTTLCAPQFMRAHDLSLLLSYANIRSVDFHLDLIHKHDQTLITLLPQLSGLQSLRLEINGNIDLPNLSDLQYLTSLELVLDQGETPDDYRDPPLYEMLTMVFYRAELHMDPPLYGLKYPPLLRKLQLKGFDMDGLEVGLLPPSLEALDLSDNAIEVFVGGSPLWPTNLKSINLRSNNIDDDALEQLTLIEWPPLLQQLDLLDNIYESLEHLKLPDSLTHLELSGKLKTLEVSHNDDSYPYFKFPDSLLTLIFETCDWFPNHVDYAGGSDDLPDRLRFSPNLEHLTLKHGRDVNNLAALLFPPSIKTLHLEDLDIGDITDYASWLQEPDEASWRLLINLEELNLTCNRINTLEFWYLPKLLRILKLKDNCITSLLSKNTPLFDSQSLELTNNILSIDLEGNKIETIEENVHLPRNLRSLNLSANSLTEFVFTESFASHQNLTKLDLGANPIAKMSVQNANKRYASPLQELCYAGDTPRIPKDEILAVFKQLGLKPKKRFLESWDDLCLYGHFTFEQ